MTSPDSSCGGPIRSVRIHFLLSFLILFTVVDAGCRTMSKDPRPVPGSPTFETATTVDPEPHVLSLTIHPPTCRWDFSSPRAMSWSAVKNGGAEIVSAMCEQRTGRTLGFHMLGHVSVELKSVDSETGTLRYLLTASTDVDGRAIIDLILREQVGYSVVQLGTPGRIQTPEEIARDIDKSAEIDTPTVRLRVLISRAAADRMLEFFHEYERRRIYENYSLTAYPLNGDGSGCTGFAVSFLEVAGLLDPEWREQWRVALPIPEELFGDPEQGIRVPIRRTIYGPVTRRWASPDEPHRCIVFYDTTAMYKSILPLTSAPAGSLPPGVSNNDPVTCEIGRRLVTPVVTVDRRAWPTPTGPVIAGDR